MIENYKHKYDQRGKHVFVPTERSVRKGRRIIGHFRGIQFPPYFYHDRLGGHAAALHAHLENSYFFKIDIKSFYYSSRVNARRERCAAGVSEIDLGREATRWATGPE